MKRSSLAVIIVSALVIIGIVFYLAKPTPDENVYTPPHTTSAPAPPPAEPAGTSASLESCTGPVDPQVSIATLDGRHKWARSLLHSNHAESALSEFRNIASLDPGYPAINLDISDALLNANHAPEASDAIKLQVEISECLANLPQTALQAYCKSAWVSEPQGGCLPELARINQQAHYQAGLVDAELARNARQAAVAAAAATAQQRSRIASVPAASPPAPALATAPEVASAKPPAEPPVLIKSADAADHVGHLATVCGTIVGKHTAEESNGKPTFINLDRLFPNQTFTIVVWGTDGVAVGELPATGSLCVTGTIAMYRGNPQVVLHDAKSWWAPAQP